MPYLGGAHQVDLIVQKAHHRKSRRERDERRDAEHGAVPGGVGVHHEPRQKVYGIGVFRERHHAVHHAFVEEKSYLKAIEIATSQMQFFSSKKIALGALLAWYISAAATAANKADTYCIEICEKAVKICENARNNNLYFKILFQELLAKSYLKLNDKENAQMYCDLALQNANSNELLYLQLRLNNLKAQIAREKLTDQADNKKFDFAQSTIKMYNRTLDLAKRLNLVNHIKKIEKELTSFKAHCQLNRIIEDK